MRILHVIEPSLLGLGATSLRLLHDVVAHSADHRHDVVLFGTSDDLELARRCGLHPRGVIQSPRRLPISGWRELRRVVGGRRNRGAPDVIHAWGMRPALVTALAFPRRPRVSSLLHGPRADRLGPWLWLMDRLPPMPIICATSRLAQQMLSSKIGSGHVRTSSPGIAAPEQFFTPRETVRGRWRREYGVPDDALVIGLPADPPAVTDVHVIANAVARLNLSGRPTFMVCNHSGRRRMYSRRFLRQLNLSHVLVIDDLLPEPWEMMRGLDAAVMFAEAQSPLPILWAVAAGLPIIAERNCIINWHDGETSLFMAPGDINSAADRMTRLHNDRSLGVRLAANAMEMIGRTFRLDAYATALAESWDTAVALTSNDGNLHRAGFEG